MRQQPRVTGTDRREPHYLAFVSYKGGVGRSLAAVSCANALARGGANVLVIDFDIEAPSIPGYYRFDSFAGIRQRDPKFGGIIEAETGLVFWAANRPKPTGHDTRSLVDGMDPPPPKPFAQHLLAIEVQGEGSLRILPAGPVGDPMLAMLASYRWQAWMRPRETERPWASMLVAELKESIRSLGDELDERGEQRALGDRPCPVDYVIIDTTAGLDATAYRVLKDLADQAVFLVTNEPGERVVADDLSRAMPAGRFHVVISRVPTQFEEANEYLRRSQWKDAPAMPMLRYDPYFGLTVLTPSVPTEGFFVDPLWNADADEPGLGARRESLEPYQLTIDHLGLLAHVLGRERINEAIKDRHVRGWLDRALEDRQEESYKLFKWTGGTIFNPSDPTKAPNVSFRVTSIRRIFNDIWTHLGRGATREDAFRLAGRHAGEGYGADLAGWRERAGHSVRGALERWCREDSQVGFGDMRYEDYDPINGAGRIEVHNAFLPPVEDPDDVNTTLVGGSAIFEGYIEGVINGLLGEPMNVEVRWQEGGAPSAVGTLAVVRFWPKAERPAASRSAFPEM